MVLTANGLIENFGILSEDNEGELHENSGLHIFEHVIAAVTSPSGKFRHPIWISGQLQWAAEEPHFGSDIGRRASQVLK